jgi:hypothetical protein
MPPHRSLHLTEVMLWHAEHGQRFSYLQGERMSEDLDDARWIAPLGDVERALNGLMRSLETPVPRTSAVRREPVPAGN